MNRKEHRKLIFSQSILEALKEYDELSSREIAFFLKWKKKMSPYFSPSVNRVCSQLKTLREKGLVTSRMRVYYPKVLLWKLNES